jgi:hypothetical protein
MKSWFDIFCIVSKSIFWGMVFLFAIIAANSLYGIFLKIYPNFRF